MKRNMLQKDLWSHTPHDVSFSTSYDGQTGKDISSLTFDDTRTSNYFFKSSNNSEVCKDDSNSYAYQQNHIPSTDDLNFFNTREDKESSDLLYNDWPDVGNFEEVGRMLRSCNSSFGLGVTGNNDEMDWFTPEESNVGCEEVLTMDFKFPCSEPNSLINISNNHVTPESDDKRSGYEFENKDQGVKSKGVLQLTNGKGTHFKKDNKMHQKRNLELDSSGYNTYLHPSYGHTTTNQTTACSVLNGMKSERNGLTSPSQKESSYVSNQIHSMETSGDPSLQEETIVKVDDRRNVHQLHRCQTLFTGNPRQMGMFLQSSSSKCDLISAQKQVYMSTKELKNQSENLEGFRHAEIGLLNVAESSSLGSGSDDISLEATILLRLQQVMEHLDLKTKLCIKDSLYRLATSAEQRHNRAGLSSSTAVYSDIGRPLLTARTNKCTGFLDIESNTNPIDRSLAHLLFHTPSDSSTLPASSPLKPSPRMHGFVTSPPAVDFKLDCREEAANRTDCKIVDD